MRQAKDNQAPTNAANPVASRINESFGQTDTISETFVVSPCNAHGLYYDHLGRTATTPNQLATVNSQVDEKAVFSVFQFGAIVPPLSPWKEIKRFLPGYEYSGSEIVSPLNMREKDIFFTSDLDQQANKIEELIDRHIRKHVESQGDEEPILLFSGGVDSGFLASRLVSLGYTKSRLVNFSFGDNDPESRLAEEMAHKLGLKFERVSVSGYSCKCLKAPGQFYDQPFADHATEPTVELAYAIVKSLSNERSRLLLDGIGADGGFGMVSKIETWRYISKIPSTVKSIASYLYRKSLWKNKVLFEYHLGLLRRAYEMPALSSVFAQNSMAGIFYSNLWGFAINQLLDSWVRGWAGESLPLKAIGVNLALKETNIFSQKALHILESAGNKVLSPFLENDLVSAGLAYVPFWQKGVPKAPIKKSLSRHIPHDMIYREKSPFSDPGERVFYTKEFIQYLRSSIEQTSPIYHLLEKKPIIQCCDKLARERRLPGQTLNLLWAITFTDRWYRTAKKGSAADRSHKNL